MEVHTITLLRSTSLASCYEHAIGHEAVVPLFVWEEKFRLTSVSLKPTRASSPFILSSLYMVSQYMPSRSSPFFLEKTLSLVNTLVWLSFLVRMTTTSSFAWCLE